MIVLRNRAIARDRLKSQQFYPGGQIHEKGADHNEQLKNILGLK